MSAFFEVTLDASEVGVALQRWIERGRDLGDVMAVVAEMLVAGVQDEFDTSGRGRWPSLAPATLARRRGAIAQILLDTGRMAAGIHPDHGPDFAEAYSDVRYAAYHVSSAPRSKIPLRDFFDVDERVFDDVEAFILDRLAGGA